MSFVLSRLELILGVINERLTRPENSFMTFLRTSRLQRGFTWRSLDKNGLSREIAGLLLLIARSGGERSRNMKSFAEFRSRNKASFHSSVLADVAAVAFHLRLLFTFLAFY